MGESPWGPTLEPWALSALCVHGPWWVGTGAAHTLTLTSIPNRVPEKETISRAVLPLARTRGQLWAHSAEPLRQPLLRRVHANAELRDAACQIFIDILSQLALPQPHAKPVGTGPTAGPPKGQASQGQRAAPESVRCPRVAGISSRPDSGSVVIGASSLTAAPILRYMGDYPSRQAWTSLELTDQIFSSALQEATLQDEVYCQILKQLTHNTKRSAGSGEGWKAQQAQAPSAPRRGGPQPPPRKGSLHCWDFLPWAVPLLSCVLRHLASLNLSALLHKMGTIALPLLLVSGKALMVLTAGQWPPCPWPQAGLCSHEESCKEPQLPEVLERPASGRGPSWADLCCHPQVQ